jgi:transcriptional regulator
MHPSRRQGWYIGRAPPYDKEQAGLRTPDLARLPEEGNVYLPKHFAITDRALLHDLMRQFSFATLVTVHEGRPVAGHLPFMLDAERGEYGTLIAHLARANQQWSAFAEEAEALVIFQGPHTYISPSWYETHPSVPTWNYMAIHAYGTPRLIEDEGRVRAALRALVDEHEQEFEVPWTMDLPEEYLRKMLRGIVAFEMPITKLEGKLKLSQNRSAHDQERVIAALAESADPLAQGVREMMEANR